MVLEPKILIAEDDFEDRYIMGQTFDELGITKAIKFVEDGSILIKYLTDQGVGSIALIVLDLNMPRLNGTETLKALKTDDRYQHIPVIIFSTSVNDIEKKRCLELGAKDYITKPTTYREYMQTCKDFYAMSQNA